MSIKWVPTNKNNGIPADAVIAGEDIDGAKVYVGRAYQENHFKPAPVKLSSHFMSVSIDGQEPVKQYYEILCGVGLKWIKCNSVSIPQGAISTGNDGNMPLFIGRSHFEGSVVVGKVSLSQNCINVSFDGNEHTLSEYEVLVDRKELKWISSTSYSMLPEGAILGGYEEDNSPTYIGRAWHKADRIMIKICPSNNTASGLFDAREVLKHEFDVLCYGSVAWIKMLPSNQNIPPRAIVGGHREGGFQKFYICLVLHNGSLTIGIVFENGMMSIATKGIELQIRSEFEILVEN